MRWFDRSDFTQSEKDTQRFLFFSILNPVMTIKSAAVFLLIMENEKIKMNDSKQNFLFFCPQYHRPDTLTYAMTVGGQDIEMQLERNNELLTKDYTESYYQEDGTRVTTVPNDIDHCFYHGRIVNDSESSVSISTCDGLRDQKKMRQRIFEIVNFVNMVSLFFCYFYTDSIPIQTHCTTYCSAVAASSWSIMLHPQCCLLQVYKPLRTFIALVGLEIWTNGDLISVTPPAGANLDAFMKWRNSELVTRIKHDNAHLISGIDFEGPTVGLAFIGTLCSGHSVGVVQVRLGATLSHEMGHNLGMDHDDSSGCLCSDDSCIMAPESVCGSADSIQKHQLFSKMPRPCCEYMMTPKTDPLRWN
uniref:ADAM metallopeptidase domain 28 n=1 Tax=Pundamilia nyererei TaxID=303518 RepID=A0A3B4FCK9_9CICH